MHLFIGDFFKKLRIFKPISEEIEANVPDVTYDVYVPISVIRKSCRSAPDYFLTIIKYGTVSKKKITIDF